MAYQVPVSSVPLLQDPPFVLALIALGSAIGYRTLRALGAPVATVPPLERGLLSAAIGLGLLQFLAFGLGITGHLTPVAVWIGLGVLAVLFAPDLWRIIRAVGRVPGHYRIRHRWIVGALSLLALPLVGKLLESLSPCIDPDGLGYHLLAPKIWLQWRTLGYLPTYPNTNNPMGVEMLFTLAMAVWSDTAAKLTHFAFGILALTGTYALGNRMRDARVGLAAVAILMVPSSHNILTLFGRAYIDLGVIFELVAAALALELWRQQRARGWLLCSALCCGFVVSYKQTGIIVVAAMGLILLWELWANRSIQRNHVVLWFALALLPVLPWVWHSWVVTGNPAFPMLAGLFPTRDWSPELGQTYTNYLRYYNWAGNHTGWGLAQRRVILFGSTVAIAIAGGLLVARWQDRQTRPFVLFTLLLTVFMFLLTGPYARYLMPLYPLLALVLLIGLPARLTSASWFPRLILAFMVVNALLYLRNARHEVSETLLAATGRLRRDTYLRRHIASMPMWVYINSNLGPTERFALVGLGGTYYCDRYCYVLKAYYEQRIRLDTREHMMQDMRRDGINYLMVNLQELPPLFGPDTPASHNEGVLPRRLAGEYGTLLLTVDGMGLYRMKWN